VRNRWAVQTLGVVAILILSSTISARAQAQQDTTPTAPAASSTTDLSGIWSRLRDGAVARGYENYVLEFGKNDSSMTPSAAAIFKVTNSKYHGDDPKTVLSDPIFQCFPPGVPRIYLYNFPMQIVQIPGQVLMLFEYDHYIRRIYTDGRPHDMDQGPLWMGDSIGKWEGDTLVVDTVNFNDKTLLDRVGRPHSTALHNSMEIAFTIDDPKSYTKPWGTKLIFDQKPDWKIMEQICEDNSSFLGFNKKATQAPSKR
jgi:hypothetical protein